jgi:hypothetical protein
MLRFGAQQWETFRHGECAQCRLTARLRDRTSARQWLQQFKGDEAAMSALRQMLSRERSISLRLDGASDDDVLDQAAQLLAGGVWHVHAPRGMHGGAGGGSPDANQPADADQESPPPAKSPSTSKELTWIEIQLVDAGGKPVPGIAYEIKLPDGSLQSGKLDALGKARREQIVAGQCEVRFPDLDGGDWRPA